MLLFSHRLPPRLALGGLAAALLASLPAAAESPGSIAGSAYGTAATSATTLHSSAFLPNESATGYVRVGTWNYRSAAAADGQFSAPLTLPQGADVNLVRFYLCDDSTDAGMILGLQRCPQDGSACNFVTLASTSGSAADGCEVVTGAGFEVDNTQYHYRLLITDTDGSNDTRFKAVQLEWARRLSPPPASATFDDVPVGDDLHQYVELLAAAGITAGCGGGDFCPDQPVTRGRLALLFARALGLHYPN